MIDETKLHPWVDSEVDDAGDLRLRSAIDEKATVATYTFMSMRNREIHKWLKAQGWASPEEKAGLLEALENLERTAGLPAMSDDPARVAARAAISKAKTGDQ